MTLLFLLFLLIVPYLLLTLLGKWNSAFRIVAPIRARVGLSLFFIFTAIGHFIRTEEMAAMLPNFVPYRVETIYLMECLSCLAALGYGFLLQPSRFLTSDP